jgi:hypothetical protein
MNLLRPNPSSLWPRAGVWVLIAFFSAGGFVITSSRVTPNPTLAEWLTVWGLFSVGCLGMILLLYEFLILWREVMAKQDAVIASNSEEQ